jgi:hypothetical protein
MSLPFTCAFQQPVMPGITAGRRHGVYQTCCIKHAKPTSQQIVMFTHISLPTATPHIAKNNKHSTSGLQQGPSIIEGLSSQPRYHMINWAAFLPTCNY